MTKKEMAKSISEKLGLPLATVAEVVQELFNGVTKVLLEEGRLELRGFGVFRVKRRKSRRGRNPRTGAMVDVPSRLTVAFKPGQEMAEQLRRAGEATVVQVRPED